MQTRGMACIDPYCWAFAALMCNLRNGQRVGLCVDCADRIAAQGHLLGDPRLIPQPVPVNTQKESTMTMTDNEQATNNALACISWLYNTHTIDWPTLNEPDADGQPGERFANSPFAVLTLYGSVYENEQVGVTDDDDDIEFVVPGAWPGRRLRFQSRETRDLVWAEWRNLGWAVKRTSSRNVTVSEHYVYDLFTIDKGMANSQYAGPLYTAEVIG